MSTSILESTHLLPTNQTNLYAELECEEINEAIHDFEGRALGSSTVTQDTTCDCPLEYSTPTPPPTPVATEKNLLSELVIFLLNTNRQPSRLTTSWLLYAQYVQLLFLLLLILEMCACLWVVGGAGTFWIRLPKTVASHVLPFIIAFVGGGVLNLSAFKLLPFL
eukprot:Platyproteum_vivax@DN9346_c0_g1_i1.p1